MSEFFQKNRTQIILFVLFVLISSISFALGYLVSQEANHAPIIIQKSSM